VDTTNVRRRLTGFATRLILGVAIVAGGLLVNTLAASAQLTTPPFHAVPAGRAGHVLRDSHRGQSGWEHAYPRRCHSTAF